MPTYQHYRQLGYAIAVQALYDFFNPRFADKKPRILRELRTAGLTEITEGMSAKLAYLLETNPKLVYERIKKDDRRNI